MTLNAFHKFNIFLVEYQPKILVLKLANVGWLIFFTISKRSSSKLCNLKKINEYNIENEIFQTELRKLMNRRQRSAFAIPITASFFYANQNYFKVYQPKVNYVALGDSLAVGLITLGGGYVHDYAKWLEKHKFQHSISLVNLGIAGWKSKDLFSALENDQHYINQVKSANIITLDIGGNDLLGSDFKTESLRLCLIDYKNNLSKILTKIRFYNPNSPLYMMDIYNPYPPTHPKRALADKWIPIFNENIHRIGSNPNYKVFGITNVYNAFQGHENEYTWIDVLGDIHPNKLGHQIICQCFIDITN